MASAIYNARRRIAPFIGGALDAGVDVTADHGILDCRGLPSYVNPVAATGLSNNNPTLAISELAQASGTKVETIRYYERIGLQPAPARTAGN